MLPMQSECRSGLSPQALALGILRSAVSPTTGEKLTGKFFTLCMPAEKCSETLLFLHPADACSLGEAPIRSARQAEQMQALAPTARRCSPSS